MHHIQEALGDLVVAIPAAAPILESLHLDYCCRGRRTLADACGAAGLDPQAVLARLVALPPARAAVDRARQPVLELVDELAGEDHARFRRELPALIALAREVEAAHAGERDAPRGLAGHLARFEASLLVHLEREEQWLFPAIRAGLGASCHVPITRLELEHEDLGAALLRVRSLTGDLTAPPGACAKWRSLCDRLRRFEAGLIAHVHLENNVLFPRVLAG